MARHGQMVEWLILHDSFSHCLPTRSVGLAVPPAGVDILYDVGRGYEGNKENLVFNIGHY